MKQRLIEFYMFRKHQRFHRYTGTVRGESRGWWENTKYQEELVKAVYRWDDMMSCAIEGVNKTMIGTTRAEYVCAFVQGQD